MSHRYIFVGGLHRSGTSLIAQCLAAHPQVSGFSDTGVPQDEGQHLQSVYPPAKVHGGPGRFGFDPSSYLDETAPLATETHRQQLEREWGEHWDLSKPYLLEKSPPNLIRSRFLQALFPDAYFIMVLRHPLVVALATQKWCSLPVHRLVEHWLVCHEALHADLPHLRHVKVVRYERFVEAPEDTTHDLFSFLELPPVATQQSIQRTLNARYVRRWRDQAKRSVWHRVYRSYLRWNYEDRLRHFGYALDVA